MPTHVILLCCTGGITARLCSLLRFLAGDLDSHLRLVLAGSWVASLALFNLFNPRAAVLLMHNAK